MKDFAGDEALRTAFDNPPPVQRTSTGGSEVIESNLVTCCNCFFCQGSDRHPNSHGCATQFVSPSDFRWRRQFFQPVRHRRPQAQQAPLQQMQMFGYRLNELYCLDSFKIQAGATSGSSREGGRQSQIVRVVWNGLVATVLLLKFGLDS